MKRLFAVGAVSLFAAMAFGKPLVLHVATNGNDRWSGSLTSPNARKTDGPLASVEGAVKLACAQRPALDGISILLHGGTFMLSEPLRLDASDSGRANAPFTLAAFE